MDYLPKIERMIELLSPPGAWTQEACFRTRSGGRTERRSRAFSRCVYGAAMEACAEPRINPVQVKQIIEWMNKRIGPLGALWDSNIVNWNDTEGRTQAEVLEFLHKCRNELISARLDAVTELSLKWPTPIHGRILEDA